MPFPHKNIRLHPIKYIGQVSSFITLCCSGQRPVFADAQNALWLIENLREQSIAFRFAVHAYCVMPDHFHGLLSGSEPTSDLLAFVKNFKGTTSNEYQRRTEQELWQKKFYDHILREGDNAASVAAYIWMNPVRKGLCMDPREYPYSGAFVHDWKREMAPVASWVPSWKGRDKSEAG